MKYAFVLLFLISCPAIFGQEIKLPKTTYTPVFRDPGEDDTAVGPLMVDEVPVTNQKFLAFVKAHPEFARSKIIPLYANSGYLSHWAGDTSFDPAIAHFPVVYVSWFVARKYCASQGKRLPTIAEWELVSDAQNPHIEARILDWYAKPGSKLREVGVEPANKYGLKDAHGLIWEWVDNFSETIMSADSRGGSGDAASLFCGGASLKAKDPKIYAAFLRFAYRSSLNARYVSGNLGFRCVRDAKD